RTSEVPRGCLWGPHRPRGPVLAQFTSPGPKYTVLGTTGHLAHNPTKAKAPAYSIPLAKLPPLASCSPGPRYFVPCYTMVGKKKRGGFAEDLARVTLIKPEAPASTFGLRHSLYTTPLIVPP
uniref:ODF3A protein n=1 Tax=Calidris pygmaea TaxID=425635 RepID=A0A8C3JC22_9CHAR